VTIPLATIPKIVYLGRCGTEMVEDWTDETG